MEPISANIIINKTMVRVREESGLVYITNRKISVEKIIDEHLKRKGKGRLTWVLGDVSARSAVDILSKYADEAPKKESADDQNQSSTDLEETEVIEVPQDTSSDTPQQ